MPKCRLCMNDRELRHSHIVPEFLYANLYNTKNHMMGVNGHGRRGWKALQNGAKEHLFCESCEQHFNEYFEKPFRKLWVDNCPLPDPWITNDVHWITVDYETFKLFHLSVLYRAGVSTLPTFAAVQLGPHKEKLRQLLLTRNPGEYFQYPVFGYAVVHHKTNRLIQMVSQAQMSRFGGRRCYGILYGGSEWWICVASDRNPEFEQAALQSDGRMPFAAVPWNEVAVIQEASKILNNAKL